MNAVEAPPPVPSDNPSARFHPDVETRRAGRLSDDLPWAEDRPGNRKQVKEDTMLALMIAMGTVVWATIGYALLQPNPPAPV